VSVARTISSVGFVLLLWAGTGLAHHAFAPVYDSKRSVTVSGVVIEFRFANPHAMLSLDVKDDAGTVAKWTVEFAGQLNLAEIGWTKESLKPGEQVTVTGNPTHVVSRQMAFVRIVKADGTVLLPGAAQRTDVLEQERLERARRRTQSK
jgi:DNA/RNA endonuclease YhcR with UshA esterase domain